MLPFFKNVVTYGHKEVKSYKFTNISDRINTEDTLLGADTQLDRGGARMWGRQVYYPSRDSKVSYFSRKQSAVFSPSPRAVQADS